MAHACVLLATNPSQAAALADELDTDASSPPATTESWLSERQVTVDGCCKIDYGWDSAEAIAGWSSAATECGPRTKLRAASVREGCPITVGGQAIDWHRRPGRSRCDPESGSCRKHVLTRPALRLECDASGPLLVPHHGRRRHVGYHVAHALVTAGAVASSGRTSTAAPSYAGHSIVSSRWGSVSFGMVVIRRALVAVALIGVFASTEPAGGATPVSLSSGRSQQLASLLGTFPSGLGSWARVEGVDGLRLQTQVRGVGLAQVSARTGELDELIFEQRLVSPAEGSPIARSDAAVTARRFATRRFSGLSGLKFRGTRLLDHRSFMEYQFAWQARHARAWLPMGVTVGVNAKTGQVSYYWSQRGPVGISTTPRISGSQARQSALQRANVPPPFHPRSRLAAQTLRLSSSVAFPVSCG